MMISYFKGQIHRRKGGCINSVLGNSAAEFGALLVLIHRDKDLPWRLKL